MKHIQREGLCGSNIKKSNHRKKKKRMFPLELWSLPVIMVVYMEGAFNNRGPLQASDDKRIGPRPLCFHQLAFWRPPKNNKTHKRFKRDAALTHL